MLDLTTQGSCQFIDVRGVDKLSVGIVRAEAIGSAVVEVKKFIGGQKVSFASALTITATGSEYSRDDIDVDGLDKVVLEVTTADPSVMEAHFTAYGEETQ